MSATQSQMTDLTARANAYGVMVRAGAVTPQPDDEKFMRESAVLPQMSKEVVDFWADGGNVKTPITLKSGEQTEEELQSIQEDNDE